MRGTTVADMRCTACSCVEFLGQLEASFCARCGHPRTDHGGARASHAQVDVVAAPSPPSPPRQVEYGLRVSPDQQPSERAATSSPERRRRGRTLAGSAVVVLAVAVAAAGFIATRGSGGAGPETSPKPPAFEPVVAITSRATAPSGLAATPAKDGGLWYQMGTGDLTRLAAASGRVAYAFPARGAALGMVVSGRTVELLTRSALVERDRGDGSVPRSLALPSSAVCCGPVVAAGALWIPLSSGLARVDLSSGAVGVRPAAAVAGLAGDDTRLWLLGDAGLVPVDIASGRTKNAVALGGLRADAIAVGADAVWAIGEQGGGPVVVRLDPDTGARQIAVALPVAASAVAVVDGAVWIALPGIGVQELDPSTNLLVGKPVAVADPVTLLPAGDSLWVVGHHGATATFARIDLHPSGR